MANKEKEAIVAEIKEHIQNSSIAIMSKYQGISVEKVTTLRVQLRGENITYKVYKNTLAKRALAELDLEDAVQYFDGPTAWAFSNDPVAPAKILKDFAKGVKKVSMVGGVLDGKVVGADQLQKLADLPTREQLLGQVVGTIAAPLRDLVGTLNAIPRNMVGVLDAIRKQKEEEAA
jgi:large subunit ribosomal protein L10